MSEEIQLTPEQKDKMTIEIYHSLVGDPLRAIHILVSNDGSIHVRIVPKP